VRPVFNTRGALSQGGPRPIPYVRRCYQRPRAAIDRLASPIPHNCPAGEKPIVRAEPTLGGPLTITRTGVTRAANASGQLGQRHPAQPGGRQLVQINQVNMIAA
jgi:hypothetical protein